MTNQYNGTPFPKKHLLTESGKCMAALESRGSIDVRDILANISFPIIGLW